MIERVIFCAGSLEAARRVAKIACCNGWTEWSFSCWTDQKWMWFEFSSGRLWKLSSFELHMPAITLNDAWEIINKPRSKTTLPLEFEEENTFDAHDITDENNNMFN